MNRRLSILWTIASLSSAAGGPSRSALACCRALARSGVNVAILTSSDTKASLGDMQPEGEVFEIRTVHSYSSATMRLELTPNFEAELAQLVDEQHVDVIHDNGMWMSTNRAAARVARLRRVPLVISTRGMLAPWALRHRRWKKRIAWKLYQQSILESAALLHATSELEASHIRAAGLRNPIAVAPNAVEMPTTLPQRQGNGRLRRVLFLGRLHPVKGLENLLQAWFYLRPPDWELVLAGADEEGYRARLETIIASHRAGAHVHFGGAVDGDSKWRLYRSADLFVLPSFTENFGMAIAEALGASVPVITTNATPWELLVSHKCGWWIGLGVQPLVSCLREAMALSDAQRSEMGQRGRRLVEERFSWPKVAAEMKNVYGWLLEGGPGLPTVLQ